LYTCNTNPVSEYVQLNNVLILYPCLTRIYYYSYLFVVQVLALNNLIRDSGIKIPTANRSSGHIQ